MDEREFKQKVVQAQMEKTIRAIEKAFQSLGFETSRGRHLKLVWKGKYVFFVSITSSDARAARNMASIMWRTINQ